MATLEQTRQNADEMSGKMADLKKQSEVAEKNAADLLDKLVSKASLIERLKAKLGNYDLLQI